MLTVYEIDGLTPVVDPTAFVAPTAVLIGDVIIGAGVYIGPGAVLRGDFGRITVEAGSNIQDTCVLHTLPNGDTVIEANGHVGHGAILHGCRICSGALIGMGAVIMDNAVIGESAIVAAQAFVKAGMQVPPGSLAAGIPAKVVRQLTEAELAWKRDGTGLYQKLAQRCLKSFRATKPLAAVEAKRERIQIEAFPTIDGARQKSTQ